jgi:hypothetical protein
MYEDKKTIAIMTGAYVPYNREVTMFRHAELIAALPDNFLKMFISHTPVHKNISKYYDIVLYDSNNVVDEKRQFSFGCAESYLIHQGLLLADFYNLEWMYKLGFDVLPDDIFNIYNWLEHIDKGYKMVTCRHGDIGINTMCFLVNVKWGLRYLRRFDTIDDMFNGKENKHLEIAYGERIVKDGEQESVYYYETPNKMFNQKIGCVEYSDDTSGVHQDEQLLARYKQ